MQSATGLMPTCAVENNDGMAARRDAARDFDEVQVHRIGVGVRKNEGCSGVAGRTDRAEQIGPIVTLIAWSSRTAAAFGPDAAQRALLADAGFILPPEFDRLCLRAVRDAGRDQIGKVFLCACCAAASC
jgi:hypothetical protein